MPRLPIVTATLWPRLDASLQPQAAQLRLDRGGNIVDARPFKLLANAEHPGILRHKSLDRDKTANDP